MTQNMDARLEVELNDEAWGARYLCCYLITVPHRARCAGELV
jgi:hypothetical protein